MRSVTVLKAGLLYFAFVFGAGFALGTVRVLWVAPAIGARPAELIEMPVMLALMIVSAAWIVRRTSLPAGAASRAGMGLLALGLVLAADFTLVLQVRGLSLDRYFMELDPLTGTLYYAMLGLLAVLPLFVRPAVQLRRRILASLAAAIVAVPLWIAYETYRSDLALERMRVAVGSRIAETPCGPIEFASRGEGPAILVVHGAGGGYDQGLEFAEPLVAYGFRVVSMSRFGYLGTPLPRDASAGAQADAHACLLDALKIERAAVIGASAGAPSAMQLALRHPRRVSAMLLLVPIAYSPHAGSAMPEMSPAARFMFERVVKSDLLFWLALKTAPATLARTLFATPREAFERAEPAEREHVDRMARHILPLSLRQAGLLNDARIATALPRYELERIAAPTLVISAADDLYGTYASGEYTAAHIPGARFIGFPSGGHLWVGHHREVLAAAKAFFGPPRLE
jgi:pimeloyl-ACP methyl ester carboxylesterase